MIKNLQASRKKKDTAKKKKISNLMRLTDEVRDHALKAYFHYCKEKAAKNFIEWRIQ